MIPTAFQSANKLLAVETRAKTLAIYRSLLRSCQSFTYKNTMKRIITEKFKANRHMTSRPQVLKMLQEADKVCLQFLYL
ncbi:hypothetical protein BDF20DRAFT_822230 [Mycotypha africana]|uniref:uncharacterized protein n=1 Tax=Mycotypha africana TaxID=64632 RepID=UPI0023003830|nr:uncharacterized protein BDF20DRAFT_822230 [Mycotypha africana]KAI8975237.1 hypothetical protein BDF20DRAFT_822230 [Mycotypha africana]